jgi:RNA polymerase sigma factor (sigma-70 family)
MGKRPRESWPLTEAQKQMVAENWRLALKFCRTHRPPIGFDQDDWQSECLHRLCVAASSYDERIGPFSTYAYTAMQRHRWHLYSYQTYERRDVRRTIALGEFGNALQGKEQENHRELAEDHQHWLAQLQPRERWVVRQYTEGNTLAEIGREMGLSRERVRQIWEKALRRIRAGLKVG